MLEITGLEADYDAGDIKPDEAAALLAKAGVASLVVTSPSHGLPDKGNRWHVMCPLSKPLDPAERRALLARLNGALLGVLSPESFTKTQSYNIGYVQGREKPLVRLVDGRFIDKCDDLDFGAIAKPGRADLFLPTDAVDQSGDPVAVAYARERLETVCVRVAETKSGENRNSAINKAAFEMGGFQACALLEHSEIVQRLAAAAEDCGYAADYGETDPVRVIETGLREGAKRPIPYKRAMVVGPSSFDDWEDGQNDFESLMTEEATTDPKTYTPDHNGAILAFRAKYEGRFLYDHDRGDWFQFTGHTWRREGTQIVTDLTRKVCMNLAAKHAKAGKILRSNTAWEAVEKGARRDRAFAVEQGNWDTDPWLLGTPAGVVDLRTGEIRDGRPEDHISKRTAVHPTSLGEFDEHVECSRWIEFLEFALAGDVAAVRFLKQWMGMSLTGETREQKLLFVHGGGGNGKGVTVNTVARVVGDYAADVPARTLTAQKWEAHPTELARLHGVRLAHASEVERNAKWADTRIKSLTGGDPITARFMRKDDFTFFPQLTLTVVGNDRPSFGALDDALRRRFLLLEMDRKPDTPDPDLPAKLWSEASGILSWMIEGALDWQRHGLVIPDAVKRATEGYFLEEDHFGRFLEECGECTPAGQAATGDIREAFNDWNAFGRDAPPMSDKAVNQEMKRRGFHAAAKVKRRDSGRGAGFRGFQLTQE